MAKIVGAKIQENVEYVREDGTTGVINKVEFRCVVKDIGSDKVGSDIARYTVSIEDLEAVFNVDQPIKNVKDFCKSILNKECYIYSKPSVFDGRVSERLIEVVFAEIKYLNGE
ncbi:MAG: hypothetical protein J6B34_03960 [Clostridia bacterium]|nr:hypothetical protein [Clostridia bacterium]